MSTIAYSDIWKYNNSHKRMVKTEYPPLISSAAAVKTITIKIKSEALTTTPLEHTYDTRYREEKSERRLVITSRSLELPNYARSLMLLTHVSSSTETPQNRKVEI